MDAALRGTESGLQPPSTTFSSRCWGILGGVMAIRFNPLEPGEPIGVVALSGAVDGGRLRQGLAVLEQWGHPVIGASNLEAKLDYLAGDDDQRLAGLDRVLDGGARVLVAARGGYGATRVLDRMPWQRMADEGTVFVGYSDVTAVLNPMIAAPLPNSKLKTQNSKLPEPEDSGSAQKDGPRPIAV